MLTDSVSAYFRLVGISGSRTLPQFARATVAEPHFGYRLIFPY